MLTFQTIEVNVKVSLSVRTDCVRTPLFEMLGHEARLALDKWANEQASQPHIAVAQPASADITALGH